MINTDRLQKLYTKREEISYRLIETNNPNKVAQLEDKLEELESKIEELEQEQDYVMDFWKKYEG
jgi:CRISPR-associated protein Cas8b1/Cst1 subtype I-B